MDNLVMMLNTGIFCYNKISVINIKICFVLFVFFFLLGRPLDAKIDVFVPYKGLMIADTLEGMVNNREVTNIFQNPAGIAAATHQQIKFDANQNFIGYNQILLGYLIPTKYFVIGIGLNSFFTSDIPRVSDAQNGRPYISDYFSDLNQIVSIALGLPITEEVQVGIIGQNIKHSLDSDVANCFGLDLGIQYKTNNFWFGGYSRNFANTTYIWRNSSHEEQLTSKYIVETGYYDDFFQLKFVNDFEFFRGMAEVFLNPYFSVLGDMVFAGDMKRYSIGAVVNFENFSLQYSHISYIEDVIGIDQDMVGIKFVFGEPVNIGKFFLRPEITI